METVTWEQATGRRLERHGLAAPVARERLAAQAGMICGVHAQVMTAGELSLALRVERATRADVRAALWKEHTLVKTYGPRGTVHLLPAAELAAWCAALDAVPFGGGRHAAGIAFSDEEEARVVAAIADALAEAAPVAASAGAAPAGSVPALTADELTEALAERCGPWAVEESVPAFQGLWPRWRQSVHRAAHAGALCFGPPRGRTVTFTNPRHLVPGFDAGDVSGDPADWLALRWLRTYGPATAPEFAKWAAAPQGWARACFETLAAAGEIEPVSFVGEEAWIVAGDREFPADAPQSVRLLPYFDAYGIGCHPRARLFPGRAAERALARGQAGPYPLLLLDGVVGGVWHQRRAGRRAVITVEPLRRLTAARRRALESEAERVASALEGRLELAIGPVRVGAHA